MTTSAVTVEREVRIEARPEAIFPFFVEADQIVKWMGHSAWLDPNPGGEYRVAISDERIASGNFVEVTPFERVVFTWGWEKEASPVRPGTSTVTVTLTPDGEHTIVRLVHSDLPEEGAARGHGDGWDHYFPRLAIAATGGITEPDPWGH